MSGNGLNLEITPDNPWPGLGSFDEEAQHFFHGRSGEIAELCGLVERNTVTVLFGQSGLGKTSLLKAGLFPRLRELEFLPIFIRLDHTLATAGGASAPPLAAQIKEELQKGIVGHAIEASLPTDSDTMWEYFFRKTTEFWSADHRLLIPVLAFDQFEEMFTLGRENTVRRERSDALLVELSNLLYGRPPKAVEAQFDETPAKARAFTRGQQRCKVVVSLREDFLPDLDDLHALLPLRSDNRFRLRRMTPDQALEAVERSGAHLLEEGVGRKIVSFVSAVKKKVGASADQAKDTWTGRDVAPALLSMVCRELNLQRLGITPVPPRISAALVSGSGDEIVASFYQRMVSDLDPGVPLFLENELLTGSGFRDSMAIEDAEQDHGITPEILSILEQRRLVVVEERSGARRVELTHDLLAGVVKISRDQRRTAQAEREAEEANRKAVDYAEELRAREAQERLEIELRAQEQRRRDQHFGTLSLRIFISSPGDVVRERFLTEAVIARLQAEFSGRVRLEAYFWEHEPMRVAADFQTTVPSPADFDVFICILWTRLGAALATKRHKPDGTTYASGTEFELDMALQARQRTGRPEVLVYVNRTPPLLAIHPTELRESQLREWKQLQTFLSQSLHNHDGTMRLAYNAYQDLSDFETKVEHHLRALIEEHAPKEIAFSPAAAVTWTGGSPFRGLRRFEFEHAPIFFGRTRAIDGVCMHLHRQTEAGRAFVMVLGASGSGKSSLVRAGVLPLLGKPGVIEGIGLWRRVVFEPRQASGDILLALSAALVSSNQEGEGLPELISEGMTVEELARQGVALPTAIKVALNHAAKQQGAEERTQLRQELESSRKEGRVADAARYERLLALSRDSQARLVLVVDQLEELFSFTSSGAEVEHFIATLDGLARSGVVSVIVTLRSDYYARCEESRKLIDLMAGNGCYHLLQPTPQEMGLMIRGPAFAAGLRFEIDAVTGQALDEVLRDAAIQGRGILPLLQLALEQLYRSRTEAGVLTFDAYRQVGGIEEIIPRLAEEAFLALDETTREALPEVLLSLVSVTGESHESLIRRWRRLAELNSETDRRFVEAFVEARLFTIGADTAGEPIVTLASEAVARDWPRAHVLIEGARHNLRVRARIADGTHRWREAGHRPALLLTHDALGEAEKLREDFGFALNQSEVEYINASVLQARLWVRRRRLARIAAAFVVALITVAWGTSSIRARHERDAYLRLGLALGEWKSGNKAQAVSLYRQFAARDPRFGRSTASAILAIEETDRQALEALRAAASK